MLPLTVAWLATLTSSGLGLAMPATLQPGKSVLTEVEGSAVIDTTVVVTLIPPTVALRRLLRFREVRSAVVANPSGTGWMLVDW